MTGTSNARNAREKQRVQSGSGSARKANVHIENDVTDRVVQQDTVSTASSHITKWLVVQP